jgi:hypothetical protein
MKSKRTVSGNSWTFDGKILTVHIPMEWRCRGGRKVIIAPEGTDAWAPAKPRPDETLIRALVRAHRWKRLLEEGGYRSATKLAEAEKITRSYVTRLLNLTLLAPDIVEAILDGRHPKEMMLDDLIKRLLSSWEKQRKRFATSSCWRSSKCENHPSRESLGGHSTGR